jgi:5-(carboxyamino)imidazole ribonucleotide mutase
LIRFTGKQKRCALKFAFFAHLFYFVKQMAKNQTPNTNDQKPIVSIIMGSTSDWETMKNAADILTEFGVAHESKVVSAHRTPDLLFEFAKTAEQRGIEVIIAGAGGAAHLPGMCAAQTVLPVLGVPVQSKALSGMDSLLSIVQMPAGIPVGTLAIGNAGAKNAALLAISILAISRPELRGKLHDFRRNQTQNVLDSELK